LRRPGYDPDGLYGLAKLAGELTLRAIHNEFGVKTASCRYFTVYGPRGVENHARDRDDRAGRSSGRTRSRSGGTGSRSATGRTSTTSSRGPSSRRRKIEDGSAINLGTTERVRVIDAVHRVCELAGYSPRIALQPDMPTGPMNRVADNSLARRMLGWEPRVAFADGLQRTLEWYFSSKDPAEVSAIFDRMLTGRGQPGGELVDIATTGAE
jgi:nucleoside-diphosphate-sugar epimerase